MRIGLIIERMDPDLGGAEQWTWWYADWLVRQGHDVHLIARRFHQRVGQLDATSHRLTCDTSRLGFAGAAEEKAKSLSLDIVHDMGAGWYCDIFQPHNGSWTAAYELKLQAEPPWRAVPKRVLRRVLPRYREFDQLIARQYVADQRLYIALAQRVARNFEQIHGIPKRQIRQIYNGVDVQRFSPDARGAARRSLKQRLRLAPDRILVLFVAHNFFLKGLDTLLRSLRLAGTEHPFHLVVVGGKRSGRFKRRAYRMGLADRVTWVGSVEDTVPYYKASDLFALPTYCDPCSLVVLEALASGLPVITSQFNGVSELLTPGQEGLVMRDPGDADELASMLHLLKNAGIREKMGRAARRLAESHSLEENFSRITAIYGEVVQRKRAA